MPTGSVLVYTSGVLHAGGYNSSDEWRLALTLGYNLAFLKSADHMCLFSPPSSIERIPGQLRGLIGYNRHLARADGATLDLHQIDNF